MKLLKKLLEETQYQTEKMRSQEEEMRQNLEELSATQEGMQRAMNEVEEKERFMNGIINSTQDSIFALNRNYELLNFNHAFVGFWKGTNVEPKIGDNIYELSRQAGMDAEHLRAQWDRALKGEYFKEIESNTVGGKEAISDASYNPLKNESGEVIGLSVFFKDVTEQELAKRNVEKLLAETQEQAEMMKAQEEEMLQNMEELSATQEEMQRLMDESNRKEKFVHDIMNSTDDTILTIDTKYKLLNFNQSIQNNYKKSGLELKAGMSIFDLIDEKLHDAHKAHYDRVLSGEKFEVTDSFILNGKDHFFLTTYNPLKDENGKVTAAAVFGKDITEQELSRREAENLLEETQQQTEEMKAQEEELRQNMEELSATQEEMQRIMDEAQRQEKFLQDMIDSTDDSIMAIDKNYQLLSFNDALYNSFKGSGIEVTKGLDIFELISDDLKDAHKKHYDRAFKGEKFEVTDKFKIEGEEMMYLTVYSPLRDVEGKVFAIAIFGKRMKA
ncbi:PAS domain-containing protein [Fulvivirga maritima]|uniref:PAS domain-containing protein n=1 Tax=Fulvivirga maritima TaxID=2904247 RepID=UPI001F2CC109|nr:PAS domain-containing protein [Fulvivirga maritima]UII27924.1 PAS domain-containing protein [Fulvivirga maritima]